MTALIHKSTATAIAKGRKSPPIEDELRINSTAPKPVVLVILVAVNMLAILVQVLGTMQVRVHTSDAWLETQGHRVSVELQVLTERVQYEPPRRPALQSDMNLESESREESGAMFTTTWKMKTAVVTRLELLQPSVYPAWEMDPLCTWAEVQGEPQAKCSGRSPKL